MIQKSPCRLLVAALLGWTALAQQKPNFTGTWELTKVERDGSTFQAGKHLKETQIWMHEEPQLTIKVMSWDENLGYLTFELSYTTDGKAGPVGYLTRPDGTKKPINGSAHWEGNRLVYEQVYTDPPNGHPSRLIRTCTFDPNGPKIVSDEVYWLAGNDRRTEAKWTWEKKTGTP